MPTQTPQPFTRFYVADGTPDTQRAVSDLYDKLASVQAQLTAALARIAALEAKP